MNKKTNTIGHLLIIALIGFVLLSGCTSENNTVAEAEPEVQAEEIEELIVVKQPIEDTRECAFKIEGQECQKYVDEEPVVSQELQDKIAQVKEVCSELFSTYSLPNDPAIHGTQYGRECNKIAESISSVEDESFADELQKVAECSTIEYGAFNAWAVKNNEEAEQGITIGQSQIGEFEFIPTEDCVFN